MTNPYFFGWVEQKIFQYSSWLTKTNKKYFSRYSVTFCLLSTRCIDFPKYNPISLSQYSCFRATLHHPKTTILSALTPTISKNKMPLANDTSREEQELSASDCLTTPSAALGLAFVLALILGACLFPCLRLCTHSACLIISLAHLLTARLDRALTYWSWQPEWGGRDETNFSEHKVFLFPNPCSLPLPSLVSSLPLSSWEAFSFFSFLFCFWAVWKNSTAGLLVKRCNLSF